MYEMILLTQIIPYNGNQSNNNSMSSSPKNDVIVGIHKNCDNKTKHAVSDLFNGKALSI